MKILFLSLLAVGAFATQAFAQVAVGPGSVKLGKVEPAGIKSPEYTIVNGPQKRWKIGTWLEVEVEYETKVEEIDELTFNFTVMVENKLADGSVTYVNIPKGKEHYAVIYVPPRALEKLLVGKAMTGSSIANAWVTVSRQGQILDLAAFKGAANTPIPNLPRVSGLLLNKNDTPFAPLFYDRYEAIKATR